MDLETRIPAGFLEGLTSLVPSVSGLNLESMVERAMRDRPSNASKGALISLDTDGGKRVEVFLE